MSDETAFLAAIDLNPDDDATRLVYADWLEERGDIRAEYLRLEHQLKHLPARLDELRSRIDPDWAARVGGRRRLVLLSYPPDRKIAVIKVIREITGMGLADAKTLSETPRATVRDGLRLEEAGRFAAMLREVAVVEILPSSAHASHPGA